MDEQRLVWAAGFEVHRVERSYLATRTATGVQVELSPSSLRILAAFAEPAPPERVAALMAERLGLPLAQLVAAIAELRDRGLLEPLAITSKPIERAGRVTPSFAARAHHGHLVLADAWHRTLYRPGTDVGDHRGDGAVFGLLQHDGFAIELLDAPYASLVEHPHATLLVHGLRPTRDGAPLERAEIDAVLQWIDAGGSALVVAGHDPNEPGLAPLLAGLGIDFRGGHAHHPDHPNPQGGPCSWFTMEPGRGVVIEHPIARTAAAGGLALSRIGYYCGGAMLCDHAAALLRMPAGTRLLARSGGDDEARDDYVGMAALAFGRGRAAVVLDRGIFRAQEIASDRGPLYITMGQPDLHNANLLVATLRWLARHDLGQPTST